MKEHCELTKLFLHSAWGMLLKPGEEKDLYKLFQGLVCNKYLTEKMDVWLAMLEHYLCSDAEI